MRVIVLDLETTVQRLEDGTKDNSPFHPKNRIVSAHWSFIENGVIGPVNTSVFFHKERPVPDAPDGLIAALKSADRIVAHNAKYDVMYSLEAGFEVPKEVWCTMIGEYILARAQQIEKGLEATAERRDVTRKKSELVRELFDSGVDFSEMPLDTVIEYAEADVISCAEVYLAQIEDFSKDANAGLMPVVTLMNEMLDFLVEIERNGISIDLEALDEVEALFLTEKEQIERRLGEIVSSVMGDTPINLNSGADLSTVIYSRRLTDKPRHAMTFNIGTDHRGKPLYPPRMNPRQFATAVKSTTAVVNRTLAQHCHTCSGLGRVFKVKKNGEQFKKPNRCTICDGRGFTLQDTGRTAGLRLVPYGPADASVLGFKTDKATIKRLINQAEAKGNLEAIEFLKGISRLNAVSTYLDSFVTGIRRWTRPDGLLHAKFNQTTTRTGRLSSSDPNFQNQPKGGKFPVRKAVKTRFKGGLIVEADFSGLEFVVAGDLSRDEQIIQDVTNKKDTHKQTATIINQCALEDVSKDMRQNAKAYTFAPLYGGQGANEPPHVQVYFREFFNIYKGLAKYHETLTGGVLKDGIVRVPSGREYLFKDVRRYPNGRVSNQTAIVNYPVQGFATGDIVPLACIRALRAFRANKLRSKLILTVHDSIVVDAHPDEIESVKKVLTWAMCDVTKEVKKRFDYTMAFDTLRIEIAIGPNWLQMEEIPTH